jgi:hypothetical protein
VNGSAQTIDTSASDSHTGDGPGSLADKHIMHDIIDFLCDKKKRFKSRQIAAELLIAPTNENNHLFALSRLDWLEYKAIQFNKSANVDEKMSSVIAKLAKCRTGDELDTVINKGINLNAVNEFIEDLLGNETMEIVDKLSEQSQELAWRHIEYLESWLATSCNVDQARNIIKWDDLLVSYDQLEAQLDGLKIYFSQLKQLDSL